MINSLRRKSQNGRSSKSPAQCYALEPSSSPAESLTPPEMIKEKVIKPPPESRPNPPKETTKTLDVGSYVVMTADVRNCDAVSVRGNLDGDIQTKVLIIHKGGCVRGKVDCDEAQISGSFEGTDLTCHKQLYLRPTARVGGRTTYNKLAVEEGAVFTGELMFKPAYPPGKTHRSTPKNNPRVTPDANRPLWPESEDEGRGGGRGSDRPVAPLSATKRLNRRRRHHFHQGHEGANVTATTNGGVDSGNGTSNGGKGVEAQEGADGEEGEEGGGARRNREGDETKEELPSDGGNPNPNPWP